MTAARVLLAALLAMVAVLLATLTAVGAWARSTLADTDGFTTAVAPLATDPALQQRIVDVATQRTMDALRTAAAENAGPLAPLADLLLPQAEPTIRATITDVVSGPGFRSAWQSASRDLHARLLADLRGQGGEGVTATGGTLTIDLALLREPLQQALAGNRLGELVAANLRLGTVTVPSGIDVERAQVLLNLSDRWAWLLPLGALILAGAAVVVAPQRSVALAGLGAALLVAAGLAAWAISARVGTSVDALPAADRALARAFVTAVDDDLYRNLAWQAVVGAVLTGIGLSWWAVARRR